MNFSKLAAGKLVFISSLCLAGVSAEVHAAQPYGWLDTANDTLIAGWALDPDFNGPIMVHIYVDGAFVDAIPAGDYRSDVGAHGFNFSHASFGTGNHTVVVYPIGVTASGQPDGQNTALSGTPKTVTSQCANVTEANANVWCNDLGQYWLTRQQDTTKLVNQNIAIGINNSSGGMISQLYNKDRSYNLIGEHGGAAMQLSLWGYGGNDNQTTGDLTDPPVPSTTLAGKPITVCFPGQMGNMVGSQRHVPWNPIQAQSPDCQWLGTENDVTTKGWTGGTYSITKQNPYNFTVNLPFNDLWWRQDVTLGDSYAKVDYYTVYNGSDPLSATWQEIPALFPALGTNPAYMYTKTVGGSVVTETPTIATERPWPAEGWISSCDSSGVHCVTIASASTGINGIRSVGLGVPGANNTRTGYLTPHGWFPMTTNTNLTVYVFPYRYDAVVNGVRIRDRIAQLIGTPGATTSYAYGSPVPFPTF